MTEDQLNAMHHAALMSTGKEPGNQLIDSMGLMKKPVEQNRTGPIEGDTTAKPE